MCQRMKTRTVKRKVMLLMAEVASRDTISEITGD